MQGGDTADVLAAGLPNITGTTQVFPGIYSGLTGGAFRRIAYSTSTGAGDGNAWPERQYLEFDASLSNSIYGASATVQPAALLSIPQIKY